jgi:hypothetical protein
VTPAGTPDPGDQAGAEGVPGDDEDLLAGPGPGEDMTGFRRTSGGVSARFSADEARILRGLVSQISELVSPDPAEEDGGRSQPAGPAGEGPAGTQAPVSPDDLADLLGQLGGSAERPADPVLARLLPDAYTDDPDAAGEFRRYTEQGLRSAKAEAAQEVLDSLPARGGRVRLTEEQGQVWARSLNDVRLALGVRLGVTEEFEDQLAAVADDETRLPFFRLYDWLTYLQETLVRALW